MRTRVARVQIMKSMTAQTLATNHSIGHHPELAPGQKEASTKERQPPRNRVTHMAETLNMLMYSPR